jgi:hypothetical protein
MQELHDVGAQVPIVEFLKGEFTANQQQTTIL